MCCLILSQARLSHSCCHLPSGGRRFCRTAKRGNSHAVQRPGEGHRWVPHFCLTSLESQTLVTDGPLASKPGGTKLKGTDPEQVSPVQRQEIFARLRLSGRGQPCSIAPLYVVAQFWKAGRQHLLHLCPGLLNSEQKPCLQSFKARSPC